MNTNQVAFWAIFCIFVSSSYEAGAELSSYDQGVLAFRKDLIEPAVADPDLCWKKLGLLLDGHPGFKLNDNVVEMVRESNQQKRVRLFREHYNLTILRLGPKHFPRDHPGYKAMLNQYLFPVPVDPVDMKQARTIDADIFMAFVREGILANGIDARMKNFKKYSKQEIEQMELVLEMVIGEDDLGKRVKAYLVYVLQVPENTHELDGLVKSVVELTASDPIAASRMVMNSYRFSVLGHDPRNTDQTLSIRPAVLNPDSVHPGPLNHNYVLAVYKYFSSIGFKNLTWLLRLVQGSTTHSAILPIVN